MSIPILYESGTTDFWNMGLGPLSDTLEATVTEQRNGEFYLDLSYPIDGARANELKNNRIIVADAGHNLKAQQFDITDVQRGLTKLTVHAEHVSYRTSRYPLTPTFKYTGNADGAIRAWQKAIVVDNNITAGSDISTTGTVNITIDKAQNARQVLGGVEGSILDVYGGEYRFDNEHISLLNHRGSVVNTLLAYGRNITDFNQEEAIGETYTSIYPYALVTKPGEDEATLITLPEYYVDGDYVKNFPQRRVLPVDLSSKFGDKNPTTVDGLRTAAKAYVKANQVGVPKVSTTISFVDLSKTTDYADVAGLEEVNLCDEVPFWFSKYDIRTTAKVSSVVWNVLSDSYNSITLGDLAASLSESIQTIATQAASQEASKAIITVLQGADGLTNNFYSDGVSTPPTAKKIGDRWFAKNGDKTSLYIWDGVAWREVVSTDTADKIAADIDAKLGQLNADMSAADENLKSAKQDVADLQVKLKANDDTQAQLKNDLSENSTILEKAQADIVANTQSLSDLDTKLKANDETQAQLQTDLAANTKVQDQLKKDLSDNVKLVNANKESVDAALVTVNKTLTQAKTDAETAVKNADDAVTTAQSAVDASGLATQTANAANEAATAAKELATSTANSFVTVKSQAANAISAANKAQGDATNALGKAGTAISNAKDALDKYDNLEASVETEITNINGELSQKVSQTTYNNLAGTVNTVNTLAKQNQETITTLATKTSVDALSQTVTDQGAKLDLTATSAQLKVTENKVDALNKTVSDNTAQLKLTAKEADLKLATNAVDALTGRVTTAEGKITATSDALKTVYTKSEMTNLLGGYATQTWAQSKITASATSLEANLTTVKSTLDNLKIGGANLLQNSDFSHGRTGWTGLTNTVWPIETDDNGDAMVHITTADKGVSPVGLYNYTPLRHNSAIRAIEVGDEWTASGYAKGKGSLTNVRIENSDGISKNLQSIDSNTWQYFEIHGTYIKNGGAFTLYCTPSDTTGMWFKKIKVERGNKATDWSPSSADLVKYTDTKVAELKLTVDGLSATFAKQTDLNKATSDFKLTSDGLNLLTTATGKNGEKVTQVIADVKNIKTTMTGANGYTTRLQTLEGFQQTATETLNGVATSSQVEQLTNLINLRVTKTDMQSAIDKSLLEDSSYKDTRNDNQPPSWYWKNYKRQTAKEFKSAGIMGLPGEGLYAALDTSVRWKDPSGGPILQTARTNTNSYTRKSTSDTNWSPWVKTTDSSNVISQINISSEGILIAGPKVHITGATTIDAASIQSAAIASLDATKITSGSISSDRLATTKLNADNITSGSIAAERLATTKLNASNITSGSINAGLITTGTLIADRISGGTFDASKMTVKNINAGSITSGSIATALLASTQINADNITSGSIAAERLAATKISATNIVGGTFDAGTMTVKHLSADMIATGTLDVSKLTAVKNFSASNIIGGTLDASTMTVKKLSASSITGGTLNAGLLNVIGLNASAITTGTISGANLAINLNTGEVMFQKGSIKSTNGRLNIDVNNGTFAQSDGTKGMLFAKGNLYLSSSSWWEGLSNPDAAPKPDYGFIGYGDTVVQVRGFEVVGRDALTLGLTDNGNPGMEYTASPVITMNRSNVVLDFAGELATIQAGKDFTIKTNPIYDAGQTPGIEIGTNVGRSGIGDRVFIDGSYVYIPSAYSRTASGSANVIVASDGALVRTSSATKYKSNIERFRNTDMGEALLNLPQAHWYNKQDMQRYADDPQHYSMPELDYGMIAEDLAAAGLEDLVVRGDDGQLEDIRYDRIAPALLPLLAKMKQEIEELKSAAKSA